MDIMEASILLHISIVLFLLWLLSSFNYCHPFAYFVSLIYLYLVHEKYVMRLRRKLKFEESRESFRRRVLSDSETVRWLNHAIEKIWPICLEQIVSQKILLPIVPWFLQKFKPWTVKDAVIQHLYFGRSPPIFTDMRVLHQSTGDDHLVLELGINFRTADDMSAILAVKLRKRLGLGMRAKLHLMGMHIEGKVLVGVKFLREWPFLGRLRVCFVEPPYFQMIVKPIFTHGLDVTELPGIAGWLDNLLALAFEQTLVEPNMLVVDVEKFVSPQPENWFSVNAKEPIAHAIVEVIEAADMKPSDLNGLADPYVKGQLGAYRFRTKTHKKTLAPKWQEEFKIPICTWKSPNVLAIEVRDKDHFVDDTLGDCSINISDLRDGQRHDIWLSLQHIKMGRLHLAITVVEGNGKEAEQINDGEALDNKHKRDSFATDAVRKGSFSSASSEKSTKVADKFEPIDIDGQRETGIWVHHPGSEVAQVWEPRKGKSRLLDNQIHGEGVDSILITKLSASGSCQNDSSSTDESVEGNKAHSMNPFRRGLHKIGSVFHRSPRPEERSSAVEENVPSPHANLRALNRKEIGVKLIVDDNLLASSSVKTLKEDGRESLGETGLESPEKKNVKDKAKDILKHAGKSARGLKHALSKKGSRKPKGDLESISTERDVSVDSDSSDEESPPPSVSTSIVESISAVSLPVSSSGDDSSKSMEHNIQTVVPNNPDVDIVDPVKKVSLEDSSGTRDGNLDRLVEPSLNSKLSE